MDFWKFVMLNAFRYPFFRLDLSLMARWMLKKFGMTKEEMSCSPTRAGHRLFRVPLRAIEKSTNAVRPG
jgi:hypothetical protein